MDHERMCMNKAEDDVSTKDIRRDIALSLHVQCRWVVVYIGCQLSVYLPCWQICPVTFSESHVKRRTLRREAARLVQQQHQQQPDPQQFSAYTLYTHSKTTDSDQLTLTSALECSQPILQSWQLSKSRSPKRFAP